MTTRRPTRRDAVTAAVGLAAAGLAACSGEDPAPAPSPSGLPAAEPADAPEPSTQPAGTVVEVGYAAEGLVRDPVSGLVAVGVRDPNRLLLLDPSTLAVARSVEVPGTVRHLAVAADGGTVVVPNEAADTVLEVDTATGGTRSTPVGHVPHDATGAPNGDLLVGDEFGGSLTVVRDGAVVHTFSDLQQPGGVVAVGGLAVVVDVGAFTVTSYDLGSMRRTGREPAGDGPTHGVLAPGGRVAVADTRGGRLLLFDVDPLAQAAALDVGTSPYGLAADEERGVVWVTLTASNELLAVDVTGEAPTVIDRYPTVRQPNSVASGPGVVWVASRTDGVVQRIVV